MDSQEGSGNVPRWENMNKDILCNIFKKLNVVDVIMGASRVCITWFLASHNKTIWNTIKLNEVDSIVLDNPNEPRVPDNVIEKRRYHLMNILTEINKFSRTVPINLFFNIYSNIQEEDLAMSSERMPNIRKLALSMWKPLNINSIQSAFSKWKNLQTLIIGHFDSENDFLSLELQAIGDNCKNLTTIKMFKMLSKELANNIICYLPGLERVSFRGSYACREAALLLINGLPNLKIFNLSHCVFTKPCRDGTIQLLGTKPTEELIRIGTERLDKLMVCCSAECPICQDELKDTIISQRYTPGFRNFWENKWKSDEIEEFAIERKRKEKKKSFFS